MSKKEKKPSETIAQEGLDYYLEHGRMVFTAHFLKKRGFCCKSGCRHCPYQSKENDKL